MLDNALTYGAEGVGLFRSEFVFMGSTTIPTEEDQFKAYRSAVEKLRRSIVCIIRTMDIGGDKPLPYLNIEPEENPFPRLPGAAHQLDRHDLFLPQIKAILRAGSLRQSSHDGPDGHQRQRDPARAETR